MSVTLNVPCHLLFHALASSLPQLLFMLLLCCLPIAAPLLLLSGSEHAVELTCCYVSDDTVVA